MEADELLPKDHRPQPVPVQKALLHDRAGRGGCTALLLIGFGIQDSILPMVAKQSTQLTHTDLTVSLNSSQALELENGLADKLETSDAVESWGAFYTHNVTLRSSPGR